MEGTLITIANWPPKGQEKLIAEFKKRTGEPVTVYPADEATAKTIWAV